MLEAAQSPRIIADYINDYADWAETRWTTSLLPGIDPSLASELVMAFGLGGETAEVAEEVLNFENAGGSERVAPDNLLKELGDSFYYFCRLTRQFGLRASTVFFSAPLRLENDLKSQTLTMVVAAGKVQEACKKYVRDGSLNREKLEAGLGGFAAAWRGVCALLEVEPEFIMSQNRAKIDARHVKGTIRGSGNDR
ncbi:hypothetical protein F6X40_17545 [Paraburkholderia sp. UCT31]|uniref:hypothetical protein n=1 Tax=Paraburkholderia sp. UCT31 TaxID=2615209 RepID=UPI0016551537|nr:hypothetical protein [Paraburkholderia sp. UCT31]MBC8738565.1 hypothetical protein [Paraburkholderia sp. UCT31]